VFITTFKNSQIKVLPKFDFVGASKKHNKKDVKLERATDKL